MSVTTIVAPPGEIEPTPTEPDLDESTRALTEGMRGLQVTAVRLAGERDRAFLLAAFTARLARAHRRDRDRLLNANLALQAELDAAAVRDRFTAAQVDALAREVADLQGARRSLTGRIETLTAENTRLRERLDTALAERAVKPARGRWRR
jgi:hypothetical protein